MIIDSFVCSKLTREITELARSYNIQILEVEITDGSLLVSYRANRIFESNEFKELVALEISGNKKYLVWSEVNSGFKSEYTTGKRYEIISIKDDFAEILDDNKYTSYINLKKSSTGKVSIV